MNTKPSLNEICANILQYDMNTYPYVFISICIVIYTFALECIRYKTSGQLFRFLKLDFCFIFHKLKVELLKSLLMFFICKQGKVRHCGATFESIVQRKLLVRGNTIVIVHTQPLSLYLDRQLLI